MSGFSFSFSGDDIEDSSISNVDPAAHSSSWHAVETGTLKRAPTSAFPIPGQAQLLPKNHDVETMLRSLPSKIAYSTLVVKLDDGEVLSIPRRELWDVRVQLMAEEDDEGLSNLGKDDVKTGVYEGGFKSWESSVDVVKVLHERRDELLQYPGRFLELGCGTALPSLAIFQWLLRSSQERSAGRLELGLADYNAAVLQLVTLPNLLLSWAQVIGGDLWQSEGELEIDAEYLEKFLSSLKSHDVSLSFFSGAWSPEFVRLAFESMGSSTARLTILGAETIYSPVALISFAETLMSLLDRMPKGEKVAFVAAKKVYFGVGGSIEDFFEAVKAKGAVVKQIREETDGVRRAVIEVRPS